MTHYDVLEVPNTATPEEITQAYRKKALKYHPDRNGTSDAAEVFKGIGAAFDTLIDPQKKFIYDQKLPKIKKKPKPKTKRVQEVHTPVANAQPPMYDLWGKKLTETEQQQWSSDLKTDPRRYKSPKQRGEFWDAYANMYEGGGETEIR